jgi:hypothetical protein
MPPRVLRSTAEPSDRGSATPALPSRATSATPSVDSTLTDASTIQQEHQVNSSMSPRQPIQLQPSTATNATTQANNNTGDDTILHRLMDMVAALQNQVDNLQQDRAITPQPNITATNPIQQEGSLPLLDDDDHINSNFGTPPIDQPAIRDEPTESITATNLQRPVYTTNTGHKLKASDFPNFYGKDNEDIDEWIEKVSAIFEYSGSSDAALLQLLPSILKDNALTWFTSLGRTMRASLQTWDQWQHALKEVFEGPDYLESMRRKCLYRSLRVDESFAD